jgi:hypothetical protein
VSRDIAVERVTGIEPAQSAWKAWDSELHAGWSGLHQTDAVPSACLSAMYGGTRRGLCPSRPGGGSVAASAERRQRHVGLMTCGESRRSRLLAIAVVVGRLCARTDLSPANRTSPGGAATCASSVSGAPTLRARAVSASPARSRPGGRRSSGSCSGPHQRRQRGRQPDGKDRRAHRLRPRERDRPAPLGTVRLHPAAPPGHRVLRLFTRVG